VAYHPYVGTNGGLVQAPECVANITNGTLEPNCAITQSPSVKSAMSSAGISNLALWSTEFYWTPTTSMYNSSGGACTGPTDPLCQDTMTGFLARSMLLAWANGASRFWWYNYDGTALWQASSGLLAAGIGFEQLQTWMASATLTNAPCTIVNSNVQYCDFTKTNPANYQARAVWFLTDNGNTTSCPSSVCTSSYAQSRDLAGNISSCGTTRDCGASPPTLSGKPILLENPQADLRATASASPNPVSHGANLTYTFTAVDNGPDSSNGDTVTTTLPSGTTFVSFTTTNGTCTTPPVGGTGTFQCVRTGSLLSGHTWGPITLTVNVNGAAGSTLTDTLTVTASTVDPVSSNNTATTSVTVQ